MLQNYEQLIDKISRSSGLTVEDVNRKVEAKCAKLSGLISKEGSAQIVASELGISFDKELMKISELVTGMKKVNLVGKVVNLGTPRAFTTKKGVESKVLSMSLADDTGNIRTVFWDTNHIALFEDGKIKDGDVIEIGNGSIRNDELHLGSFSDVKPSSETFENVKMEKKVVEKNISDLSPGQNVKLRGILVQVFDPRFFEVCPECGKKAVDNSCGVHGAITPVKKALIGIVIDDGTENMRGVVFSDQIKELGVSDEEVNTPELFQQKKNELLGEEFYFSSNVRSNALFNTTELVVNSVQKVDLDNLIENLKQ